uniref:Uncharacterized protein n=1 Tax=Brassica campestris TaxID=3711 RepID=M4F2R9_BRACM
MVATLILVRDERGDLHDQEGHLRNVAGSPEHRSMTPTESTASCNGADNLFMQQRTVPAHQQRVAKEFYDTAEHASSFTQTKLVPEIYPKDEINEMFYGVFGAQEKNEGGFQMKLDGVYYPPNDNISWLTTCMEEMRQDKSKIQHAADKHRPPSIDRHNSTSIDDDPKNSHPMKSQPDFHTRAEIDQLVENIYRTLETTKERLDRGCDDIYFPMDLSMNALTSQIEEIHRELVEIHSYIARPPEASSSINRRNKKLTDIHRQTSVDDATNRGRLVPKVTSDMSDTQLGRGDLS